MNLQDFSVLLLALLGFAASCESPKAPGSPSADTAPKASSAAGPLTSAAAPVSWQEKSFRLANIVSQEAFDASWTATEKARLATDFAGTAFPAFKIACYRTVCRLDLDSQAGAGDLVMIIHASQAFAGRAFYVDGELVVADHTIIYLSREDTGLPTAPNVAPRKRPPDAAFP